MKRRIVRIVDRLSAAEATRRLKAATDGGDQWNDAPLLPRPVSSARGARWS